MAFYIRQRRVFFRRSRFKSENIHGKQQLELLIIFFYLIYLVEWIIKGYRNISFEKEAYSNQDNLNYIEWIRKPFAMWRK